MCISEFETCVFQVQAKQSYHHQLQHFQYISRKGVGPEDAEDKLSQDDLKQYNRICVAANEERGRNKQAILLNEGRSLRFSDSFQLLHMKSKKYLRSLFENAADVEGNRVQVVLSETASCFRMQSVHHQKHAGDTVLDLEAVLLLPEGLLGAALNYTPQVERTSWARGLCDMLEASVYGRGATWLVQHYARDSLLAPDPAPLSKDAVAADSEEARPSRLRCGQVVRLLQILGNAFAGAPGEGAGAPAPAMTSPTWTFWVTWTPRARTRKSCPGPRRSGPCSRPGPARPGRRCGAARRATVAQP